MTHHQWIQPEVDLFETSGGDRILTNRVPLDPYPDNLCEWLHTHAKKYPDKNFL